MAASPSTAARRIQLTEESLQIIHNKDSFAASNPIKDETDISIFNRTPHVSFSPTTKAPRWTPYPVTFH